MNSTTIAGWANGENNPHTHTQARRVVDRAFVLRTTTDGCVCSSTTTSSPSKVKDEKEEEELLPTSSPAESWKHSEQSKWSAAKQASSGSAPNKKAKWVEWWVDGWLAIFGFSFFFFSFFFFWLKFQWPKTPECTTRTRPKQISTAYQPNMWDQPKKERGGEKREMMERERCEMEKESWEMERERDGEMEEGKVVGRARRIMM